MIPMAPSRAAAPRPKQNGDGQRRQIQSSVAPQPQAASPFPQTMGAGFPDAVQSFPTDMGTLQQMMMAGFAPGANDAQAADAQNAYALARAQEQASKAEVLENDQDADDMATLGPLMRRVMERRGMGGPAQGAAPRPAGY